MSKWNHLLEAEDRLAKARRDFDTSPTWEKLFKLNRELHRAGRDVYFPPNVARNLLLEDIVHVFSSRLSAIGRNRYASLGTYKYYRFFLNMGPNDSAIRLASGDVTTSGSIDWPEGADGNVHTYINFNPAVGGHMTVRMSADYGWGDISSHGVEGETLYCEHRTDGHLRISSAKMLLDMMVECYKRHIEELRRRFNRNNGHRLT